MRLRFAALATDAWRRFRRDADLLVRVAGVFFFLPALALELLVPPAPAPPAAGGTAQGDALRWADALAGWAQANGGWYLLAYAAQVLGAGAILALYLHRPQPDARAALRRAGVLWLRLFLAAALVAIPAGAGLLLWVLPGLYVMGRTMAAAPVLVAEPGTGAAAGVARALALSRGAGLTLTAAAAAVLVGGYAAATPFAALGSAGPVAAAVGALGGAAVTAASALANTMLALSAYRLLAAGPDRQGT